MAGVVRDWRIEFMEAHPRLFGIASQGYAECGEGWRDVLERASVRIEAALGPGDSFKTLQIKEKYGSLRWYYTGRLSEAARAPIEEAIELAEARSACTCEVCGEPGRLNDRGGWLATASPAHALGEPVPVRPGCENVHVVRQVVEGHVRIVSCRQYNRDADAFLDVDPQSLGIKEE
jgi:hypothetical protein